MAKRWLHYALLVVLVVASIGPFAWLVTTSFKAASENIFATPPRFWPEAPTWENYATVWRDQPMGMYMLNSLVITLITVVFNVIFSTLSAYPLARMQFDGQRGIFLAILATMMIPFQVIMIPLFLVVLQLGLTDHNGLLASWVGLSLPFLVSGFGIFFVRQALVTLPKELEESAVLDGCNSFQVLTTVLLPLIMPTLATLAVFTFMSSWGELLWPSIVLSEPEYFTLPLGLVQLQGAFSANWRLIAAGTVLAMVPMLVFFFALQRYFVAGATSGAVKG